MAIIFFSFASGVEQLRASPRIIKFEPFMPERSEEQSTSVVGPGGNEYGEHTLFTSVPVDASQAANI